ncbi:hypothetical protein [Leptolyngbya iicbica]|nr:hypothetical protein [Leptolyngbya sp. LK]
MKRTSVLPYSLTLYPLVRNLFRDSAVLTFAFLAIAFLICL